VTLGEVLTPLTIDSFLREHIGQGHVLMTGRPGRFKGLVSWQMLNEALSRLRVNDNRAFLVRDGQAIPRSSYVHTSATGKIEYLNSGALLNHISTGASLVVNQVDEILPEIRTLAESCEATFGIYVTANLYAGWRTSKAFDVHWDDHDTLIIQAIGRKDWTVWAPTRQHPLPSERERSMLPPSQPAAWKGTLQDGDALYMPRGWWHVAHPRDEPSVHVTLTIKHQTGLDLARWILDRLTELPEVRMDIPLWRNGEEQARWLRSIRDAFNVACTEDVISQYQQERDSAAHARPVIRLPEQPIIEYSSAVEDGSLLRLTVGRRLKVDSLKSDGDVTFTAAGRDWRCSRQLAPALMLLNHITPCTLAQLNRTIDVSQKPGLRALITALVMASAIWIEPVDAVSSRQSS
jgi:ribosomal protein L16 Arg81 hydroxylase